MVFVLVVKVSFIGTSLLASPPPSKSATSGDYLNGGKLKIGNAKELADTAASGDSWSEKAALTLQDVKRKG